MRKQKLYEKLARLAVRRGVNVQPGQPLVIRADVRDHLFIEMCVKEAYEAGAGSVSVDWRSQPVTKMDYTYQTEETLADIGHWVYDREKGRHEAGACYLSVVSDMPGALKDIDASKIHAYQKAYYGLMADLQKYTMNNEGQWSVIGVPSMDWAKAVFPDLPEEEAFEKLEDAIFAVTRVSEDNDPAADWQAHDDDLISHAQKLNAYAFKELHFTSELGTDLHVGLVKNHIWVGGGCTTPAGVYFDPNMPTEEIFCMPEKTKVSGTVYASKPLSYNGILIDGFHLVFKDGKVISHGAEKEEEALGALLDFDEGSRYLGEVALVPYDSPVSQSGILFLNTLYDENAACHLALGRPYPENLQGGTEMSEEELEAHGANSSSQHHDFMFGTAEMNIDGICEDGTAVPVFRHGNFVF